MGSDLQDEQAKFEDKGNISSKFDDLYPLQAGALCQKNLFVGEFPILIEFLKAPEDKVSDNNLTTEETKMMK